jgi:NDP-sugar pyrophosphorylase family protein/lipopolysaccharide/colanic/teichoic acid biosynthesis glycosyltransferase
LLVRAGLRDIGVSVYNKAGCIEAHFGAGTGAGAQLTYLLQREPLGTAGSLRWAAWGLKESFVVLPGDAIVDFDICAALAFHQANRALATVIVHSTLPDAGTRSAEAFNPVAVAPGGGVIAAASPTDDASPANPPAGAQLFSATGAYIFEPEIFDCIATLQARQPGRPLDCTADLLPALLGRADLRAYVAEGYWNPLHSVPAYQRAQLDALDSALDGLRGQAVESSGTQAAPDEAGKVRYAAGQDRELAPGILAGRRVSAHPSARLIPPVYIGAGSQIEADAELGPDAVIGANAVIDQGATIRNSSVLDGTYVGRLVKVEGRVVRGGLVVDTASGESIRVEDRFLLAEVSGGALAGLVARAANWGGALLLLALSLPMLAAIAVALLLSSPFDGEHGRVFEYRPRARWQRNSEDGAAEKVIYEAPHFRTRRANGSYRPLGAFLERTQLDWLPALVSVLRGEMRLVGVRPLEASEADRLTEEWQRLPYEGLPGFTGLWYTQGNGLRGADLDESVAIDAYYAATRNLREDARILLLTPLAWLRGSATAHARARRPRPSVRSARAEGQLRSLPRAAKDAAGKQAGD